VSRLIAYFGNEPERLACALSPARTALYSRSAQPQGWGLGFVQGGDVLLQKRPRAAAREIDFFSLSKDLRAEALIGRVGVSEDGNTPAEDADPFRFRSWLFASMGGAAGFEAVRERLLESVPDFLRRNIRGRSPSEHIFHLFLAFLHDGGILETASPPSDAVQRALHASVAFVDKLLDATGGTATRLALCATNGRCLIASVRAHPMQYLEVAGISDCLVCRARAEIDGDERRVAHEGLRAVVLESNANTEGRPGWQKVPSDAALVVGADRIPSIVVD